ncbi:hypothetical protein HYH02_004602 [Chlamydomonas schloesseri]|uniref:MIB/HERC2 domain-containing protein n=1 Tax=Chlamydomonas schloesseri TaxID=2026947 RepID=A0A835WQD6_9CHLO|nr:hypothetical protein HYH02_004602 [Chlamydomonas schloesseri]|eukprot:KAG2450765.1 hypothetical protein HYH02_004602 [Chlamydomonas schloesseri]
MLMHSAQLRRGAQPAAPSAAAASAVAGRRGLLLPTTGRTASCSSSCILTSSARGLSSARAPIAKAPAAVGGPDANNEASSTNQQQQAAAGGPECSEPPAAAGFWSFASALAVAVAVAGSAGVADAAAASVGGQWLAAQQHQQTSGVMLNPPANGGAPYPGISLPHTRPVPGEVVTADNVYVGLVVRRGPDWDLVYDNWIAAGRDGGPGSDGVVTQVYPSGLSVTVRWRITGEETYCSIGSRKGRRELVVAPAEVQQQQQDNGQPSIFATSSCCILTSARSLSSSSRAQPNSNSGSRLQPQAGGASEPPAAGAWFVGSAFGATATVAVSAAAAAVILGVAAAAEAPAARDDLQKPAADAARPPPSAEVSEVINAALRRAPASGGAPYPGISLPRTRPVPGAVVTADNVYVGLVVRRSPDWETRYDNWIAAGRDGGPGSDGVVTSVYSNGLAVTVRWRVTGEQTDSWITGRKGKRELVVAPTEVQIVN